jgi:hypothetical protein
MKEPSTLAIHFKIGNHVKVSFKRERLCDEGNLVRNALYDTHKSGLGVV